MLWSLHGASAQGRPFDQKCWSNPRVNLAAPSFNGWGNDLGNTRFQTAKAAGLTAATVPQLKLKWAFGIPGASSMFGQPAVISGRVVFGTDTGYVYALDVDTGCVYWSRQAQAGVRTAVSVGPLNGPGLARYAAYFGDLKGNVYAVDFVSGTLLWQTSVDPHALARVTGAPKLYKDRLYVPVASAEEAAGAAPEYPCCTFRGNVVTLDAASGRKIWKSYTIPEEPKPTRKTSAGTQLWGPSGAAVWSSPTIDAKRNRLYVATGNSYSAPAAQASDALVAMDLATGKILWSVQDTLDDAWVVGCPPQNRPENCPQKPGPDYDFGSSPILRTLPDGREVLVAGQKSGIVWGHDPAKRGAVVWTRNTVHKQTVGSAGEIVWGGAADAESAYFGLNSGGMVAIHLATGKQRWYKRLDPQPGMETHRGHSGALTAIPGVVFSAGRDGVLRALATATGRVIWEYDTARQYETVDGITAKGGSMGAPGPSVAGGMLFVGSGYPGLPGNVMLAFSTR
jgi:polyvinyl alcohol dehydrogenase (cytochrome)